jgi:two-component system NtrC family response regulator
VGGIARTYPLLGSATRIGSVRDNEVVLPVRGVSRQHARLDLGPDGLVLEDLGSKNGSVVNGVRVQRSLLRPGDELGIGPVALRLEAVSADDTELAVVLDGATPAPGLSSGETTAVFEAGPGLELVEEFLTRLGLRPEPDLRGALAALERATGASGVCLCEANGGEPLIVASSGIVPDLSASVFERLVPRVGKRPVSGTGPGDPLLAYAALPGPGREGLVLVAWGEARVRGPALERLLRILLLVADRLRVRPLHAPEPESPSAARGLVFPEGYVPGRSPAAAALHAQMRPLVEGDLPVLLLGETGVGKERLVRILHASSPRCRGPFVAINCAAIPAELLEAEMFGVGKGVATGVVERPGKFKLAEGGTLFLDEIGDMPLELQAKLLRALQEKEIQPVGGAPVAVDIRVLAATNLDLHRKMQEGRFRRDLYYRVAGFVLRIPPLRERREDIPGLVEDFVRTFARAGGKLVRGITVKALRALGEYGWPGNVRELEHEVRRLVYLCPAGQAIDSGMLSDHIVPSAPEDNTRADLVSASLDLAAATERLERQLIRAALGRTGGNRTAAAKLLGISRNGLAIKMERFGIDE